MKFKSTHDGPVAVSIAGRGTTIALAPGDIYETDDKAEVDALKTNPDLEQVKQKKGK